MVSTPDGNTVIHSGDLLVGLSETNTLARFAQLFQDGQRGGADECYLYHGDDDSSAPQKKVS